MGCFRDLTGQRFYMLTVISLFERKHGEVKYNCRCDCGKELVVSSNRLVRAQPKKSCGCYRPNRVDPKRMNKRCSVCKCEKPIDQFGFHKGRPDGRAQHCQDCGPKVYEKYIKGRYQAYNNAYNRNKRKVNPSARMLCTLRGRLKSALKGKRKTAHTLELLGCSIEEFRQYLEIRFKLGMTWDNHGLGQDCWQIDHIKPCCTFDLTDPEQQKQCFHYTNLQPLWGKENRAKGGRYG